MQQFNIDISQPRGPLVLYASQGDSLSRFFSVTVTDNGAAYEPPTGAIYTVRFGSPGMPAGWYDTITEGGGGTHPAVVVDGNTYTVEIAEQALGTPGENALVLIVSDATGYTLASWAFVLQVAAVPGYNAPEVDTYYNLLTEQVAQVLANAQAAAASATLAESWAVGGTGTRPGEDTNNAEYWASEAQRVSQGALGWYETEQALQAAHPTGENGQWAIIGSTDTIWTWDSDTSAWVNSGAQVDLSNYYTKAQADAAFATAAQGTKADSAVQSVNGKTGTAVTLDPQDVGGISIYTHTRSGTVNEFTGDGPNGRAKMTADVQAGDTFTVNGAPVTAYMGTDDAIDSMAGSPWNGKWVSFIVEDGTLNFKGGGGKVTVTGLTAGTVKNGTTVTVKQGAKTVMSVAGTYTGEENYELLATAMMHRNLQEMLVSYWNGRAYATGNATTGTVTVKGTVKKVIITNITGGSICGHSSVGTFTSGHTNTIRGVPNIDNKYVSFVVLGIK